MKAPVPTISDGAVLTVQVEFILPAFQAASSLCLGMMTIPPNVSRNGPNAKGRSIMASNSRQPAKRWRVSAQAMLKPKTALIPVASSEAPKLSRSEASTRGVVTTCQNFSGPSSAERRNTAESGIRTISER